jgi:PAS domain S-box-containing protein
MKTAASCLHPATTRIFGYEPVELIGKSLTVLMPELIRKLHEAGFRRYLATGQRHLNWQGTDVTGLRKNGQEFPVEVSFGEMTSNGHKVFTGFIRDISEKKRAEAELRESEARFRLVADSAPVMIRVLLHPECHDRVHRPRIPVSKPRLPERGVRRA